MVLCQEFVGGEEGCRKENEEEKWFVGNEGGAVVVAGVITTEEVQAFDVVTGSANA